jgi:hypothetical protein
MNLYRLKANITKLATWLDMLTYVIGVINDNQRERLASEVVVVGHHRSNGWLTS